MSRLTGTKADATTYRGLLKRHGDVALGFAEDIADSDAVPGSENNSASDWRKHLSDGVDAVRATVRQAQARLDALGDEVDPDGFGPATEAQADAGYAYAVHEGDLAEGESPVFVPVDEDKAILDTPQTPFALFLRVPAGIDPGTVKLLHYRIEALIESFPNAGVEHWATVVLPNRSPHYDYYQLVDDDTGTGIGATGIDLGDRFDVRIHTTGSTSSRAIPRIDALEEKTDELEEEVGAAHALAEHNAEAIAAISRVEHTDWRHANQTEVDAGYEFYGGGEPIGEDDFVNADLEFNYDEGDGTAQVWIRVPRGIIPDRVRVALRRQDVTVETHPTADEKWKAYTNVVNANASFTYYQLVSDDDAAASISGNGGDKLRVEIAETSFEPIEDGAKERLTSLEAKTEDLQAGPASTGWVDATTESQGGVALRGDATDLAEARAVSSWELAITGGTDRYLVTRIPADAKAGQYRVRITSSEGNRPADLPLTGLVSLGQTEDGNWQLYALNRDPLGYVSSITLQLTGDAVHLGKSRFTGIFDGEFSDRVEGEITTVEEFNAEVAALRSEIDSGLAGVSRGTGQFVAQLPDPESDASPEYVSLIRNGSLTRPVGDANGIDVDYARGIYQRLAAGERNWYDIRVGHHAVTPDVTLYGYMPKAVSALGVRLPTPWGDVTTDGVSIGDQHYNPLGSAILMDLEVGRTVSPAEDIRRYVLIKESVYNGWGSLEHGLAVWTKPESGAGLTVDTALGAPPTGYKQFYTIDGVRYRLLYHQRSQVGGSTSLPLEYARAHDVLARSSFSPIQADSSTSSNHLYLGGTASWMWVDPNDLEEDETRIGELEARFNTRTASVDDDLAETVAMLRSAAQRLDSLEAKASHISFVDEPEWQPAVNADGSAYGKFLLIADATNGDAYNNLDYDSNEFFTETTTLTKQIDMAGVVAILPNNLNWSKLRLEVRDSEGNRRFTVSLQAQLRDMPAARQSAIANFPASPPDHTARWTAVSDTTPVSFGSLDSDDVITLQVLTDAHVPVWDGDYKEGSIPERALEQSVIDDIGVASDFAYTFEETVLTGDEFTPSPVALGSILSLPNSHNSTILPTRTQEHDLVASIALAIKHGLVRPLRVSGTINVHLLHFGEIRTSGGIYDLKVSLINMDRNTAPKEQIAHWNQLNGLTLQAFLDAYDQYGDADYPPVPQLTMPFDLLFDTSGWTIHENDRLGIHVVINNLNGFAALRVVFSDWRVEYQTAHIGGAPLVADAPITGVAVNWDASRAHVAKLTLTERKVLEVPTNMLEGARYDLLVTQDGVGGHTLEFHTNIDRGDLPAPVLSTNPNRTDILSFTYFEEKVRYLGIKKGYEVE